VARTLLLAACLSLLLPAARSEAQETYTIHLKPPDEGETTRYEDTLTTEMTTRQTDASGALVASRQDHSVRRTVYQETILQRYPMSGKIHSFRRQCERATLEVNKKETQLPYHRRAFTVERTPEGCRVYFEGPAPPEEFVHDLEEGFARKKDSDPLAGLLPSKAVSAGESWVCDPQPLLRAWPKPDQVRVAADRAHGTGKLSKVYRRDGLLFGVLEFRVEAPVVGVEFGGRAALESDTSLTFDVTVDACIDGAASALSLRMQDELRVRVRLPAPAGQQITATLAEEHVRTETRP
jgi:hypothetical protein